jgi:hypothetical protein
MSEKINFLERMEYFPVKREMKRLAGMVFVD